MRVLVTGARGGVGRAVVEGLLATGTPVRASSRDPANAGMPAGVEVMGGDLWEPASMAQALDGVNAVFLYAQGKRLPELMAEMKRAGVEQVVVLSTIDATNEHDYARYNRRRHLDVEEAVAGAGFRHTFLRPGAFASNARRFWSRAIATEGVVRLPYPDAEQAPIDERDIAAVAIRALLSHDLDDQAVVLTGPESLTQRKQLECIGTVLGRPIRVETISEEEARARFAEVMPTAYIDLLLSQWADEVGVPALVTDVVPRMTGRPATPYAAWVTRNADAFRAAGGSNLADAES